MTDAPGTTPTSDHNRALRTQRTVLIGLVVNVVLAITKLIAGLIGNCYALVADAIESIADILGSVVIWGGLRVGSRPADDNHAYGHGKAEALAAMVVAGLVFFAGIGIAVKAVGELVTPHHAPAPFTLVVLVVVVIAKWLMSRYTGHVARQEASDATDIDAWHHLSDAITSLAAFVGISIALFGEKMLWHSDEWAKADDWAALLASVVIMVNGGLMARRPLRELMDTEPDGVKGEVCETIRGVEGVRGIEKCRARSSGGRHYLEIHVEVDPLMSVREAHAITGKIKAAVRAKHPRVADVLLHVEPYEAGAAGPSEGRPDH
ncbi:MAG: cation transporter [Phycisphaerales bacterium]|nr:cation transporter [Phycisphaerales bacterium]